jgi:hypothetical protein
VGANDARGARNVSPRSERVPSIWAIERVVTELRGFS